MRVRVFQIAVGPDKRANLDRVLRLLDSSDADLNVFPEYLMGVGPKGVDAEYARSLAEPLEGEFASSLLDKTRERGFAAAFTLYLREGEGVSNAAVLADRGRVLAVYRKIHLFDAFGYRESSVFKPGSEPAVARLENFTVGLAVCFDLRFPELFRAMARAGVDLFLVPSAWYRGPYKAEQWKGLTSARAHENLAYLVAADQAGDRFIGHSVVVNPWGHALVDLGEGEKALTAELDPSEVREAREAVRGLELARWDLYARWYARGGSP